MSRGRSGPCMCGALDCPDCYPGCNDWTECQRCEKEIRKHEMDDGYCPECKAHVDTYSRCYQCDEEYETDNMAVRDDGHLYCEACNKEEDHDPVAN